MISSNAPALRQVEKDRIALDRALCVLVETFVDARRRWVPVVTLDVLAVVARAETLGVTRQPRAKGVTHHVEPVLPRVHDEVP
jgi:hypothetical protein